jgi:hypothetical protein
MLGDLLFAGEAHSDVPTKAATETVASHPGRRRNPLHLEDRRASRRKESLPLTSPVWLESAG